MTAAEEEIDDTRAHEDEDSCTSTSETAEQVQETSPSTKKKKKKKKKGSGGSSSDSSSNSSNSSNGSADAAQTKVPPEIKAEIDRKFALALEEATKDREEIISLDGCYLRNSQLNKLIARLEKNRQLITLVLTNNLLSDDACKALSTALSNHGFCPELMSVDVRGNKNMSAEGHKVLDGIAEMRPAVHIVYGSFLEEEVAPKETFDEMLKAGSLQVPESEPRASPAEQWAALEGVLNSDPNFDYISRVSELVRDIADAVTSELFTEEVLEGSAFEGTNAIPSSHTVFMPPREYSNFAIAKLPVLHRVLDIVPKPVPVPASSKLVSGIGSHRFHAGLLVCQLVRAALATTQGGVLLPPIVESKLFLRIAHLAFSHPNSSCMHATLLGALQEGILASMPHSLWGPLLQENFGLTPAEVGDAKPLPPLPDIIMQHASKALKQRIGQRSGIVGLVIILATLFADAAESNADLKASLTASSQWTSLVQPGGPLDQLKAEQAGGLGGGKPACMGADAMFDEASNSGKEVSRVMLGIRDFSFMHQSLNLAAALH